MSIRKPENVDARLRRLPIDTNSAPTIEDARKAIRSRQFSIVFCEESLADGSYRDLFLDVESASEGTRFVLLLCSGEWEEYLEALSLGVEEVLRCPLQPTDVDLALIHAMRNGAQKREMALHA